MLGGSVSFTIGSCGNRYQRSSRAEPGSEESNSGLGIMHREDRRIDGINLKDRQ